jgi:eukaryotic-like serine/threonine-protein kinase
MVTTKGRVKVLDFGLAKFVVSTGSFPETQSLAGTPPYMAPEQLRGESVDTRTDLYALGNVLFEMAAGRIPFQDESMGRLIEMILYQPPVHLRALKPELSADLDNIIAKALEKDRSLRYQSATDLRADLTRLLRAGA